jgi:hypothetical protein
MAQEELLLVSIVAMWIFPSMLLTPANSEEVFPEADGPTSESSDEPWLRSGPPPRVVNVEDYGAGANGDCDDTEVKLFTFSSLDLELFVAAIFFLLPVPVHSRTLVF